MNITINILEAASELAHLEMQKLNETALKYHPEDLPFPIGIEVECENGDIMYSDEAQDTFSELYDKWVEFLLSMQDDGHRV
jgi:hypothetical protein